MAIRVGTTAHDGGGLRVSSTKHEAWAVAGDLAATEVGADTFAALATLAEITFSSFTGGIAELDEDREEVYFLSSVYDQVDWEVTITFEGVSASVLVLPQGVQYQQISSSIIRLFGYYDDIFDQSYIYRTAPGQTQTFSTTSTNPDHKAIGWITPVHSGEDTKEVEVVFETITNIDGEDVTETVVMPQSIHWNLPKAVANFRESL